MWPWARETSHPYLWNGNKSACSSWQWISSGSNEKLHFGTREWDVEPGRYDFKNDGLGVSPVNTQVPKLPAIELQLRNSGQAKQVRGRQDVHGVGERFLAGNRACISQGESLSLTIRIRDNGLSTLETSILRPLQQDGGRRQEKKVDGMCLCWQHGKWAQFIFSIFFTLPFWHYPYWHYHIAVVFPETSNPHHWISVRVVPAGWPGHPNPLVPASTYQGWTSPENDSCSKNYTSPQHSRFRNPPIPSLFYLSQSLPHKPNTREIVNDRYMIGHP